MILHASSLTLFCFPCLAPLAHIQLAIRYGCCHGLLLGSSDSNAHLFPESVMTMEIHTILPCPRQPRRRCLQLASMPFDEVATIRLGLLLATRRLRTHLRRPLFFLPLLRQPIVAQSVKKSAVFHTYRQSCGCLCLDGSTRNGFSDNALLMRHNHTPHIPTSFQFILFI